MIALRVTMECTSLIAVAGLAILAMGMLGISSARISRVLLAFIVGAAIVVTLNALRLAFLVASYRWWGFQNGFEAAHVFYGSIVSIVGIVAGVGAFLFIATRGAQASNT
jgi:exosortase/archaeosortase family protein